LQRCTYACVCYTNPLTLMENAFESQVEKELKSMDQRLYDLEEKMTSIDTKLTQVVDAILGNALTKTGGFVADINELKDRIRDLETKLQKQEEFKKRFTWTVGIIIGIGVLLQYITTLYRNIK
jgi:tetrahydromethanopterin S-methyltransferase subunit G